MKMTADFFLFFLFTGMQYSTLEFVLELTHVRRPWDSGAPSERGVVVAAMSQKKRTSTSLFKPFTCLNMKYSYLGGQTMYSDSHTLSWAETIKGDKYLISFVLTFLC